MGPNDLRIEDFRARALQWRQDIDRFMSLADSQTDQTQRRIANQHLKELHRLQGEAEDSIEKMQSADEQTLPRLREESEQTGEILVQRLRELGEILDQR